MNVYQIIIRDAHDHETVWADVGIFDDEHYRDVLDEMKKNVKENYGNDVEVIFRCFTLNKKFEVIDENGEKVTF